ncbi:MAG: FYVE zinc finger domain-containing protein, partial [Nitrososphaerota archaeon]
MNKGELLKRLRYGRVVKYIAYTSTDGSVKAGGYGWLTSEITPNEKCEYWFHVKTIKSKYPSIQEALDREPTQFKKVPFSFWYTVTTKGEKTFVDSVWLDWREIQVDSKDLAKELFSRLQQCEETDKPQFARKLYTIASDLLGQHPTLETQALKYLNAEALLYILETQIEISGTTSEVFLRALQESSTRDLVHLYAKAQRLRSFIVDALESRLDNALDEDINLILTFLLDTDINRYIGNHHIRLLARQHFPPDKYVKLMNRAVACLATAPDLTQVLTSEMEEFLQEVNEEQLEDLWSHMPAFKALIEVEGRLWNVAPVSIKRELLRTDIERFHKEPRIRAVARQYLPPEDYLALLDQVMSRSSADQALGVDLTAEVEEVSNELSVEALIRLYDKLQASQTKTIVLRVVEERLWNATDDDASRIVRFLLKIDEDCYVRDSRIRAVMRQCFTIEEYVALLNRALSRSLANQSLRQELTAEVEELLSGLSGERLEKLWSLMPAFKALIEVEGRLWNVAPVSIKRKLLRTNIERFLIEPRIRAVARQCFPLKEYVALLDKAVSCSSANQSLRQELTAEVEELLSGLSGERLEKLWSLMPTFRALIEVEGRLWNVAPVSIKRELLMKLYFSFFQILQRIRESVKGHGLDRHWDIHLNNDDVKLISAWDGHQFAQNREQYQSARCAEKLALEFIRSILPFAHIEDLSILQVKDPRDERWKLADIQVSSRNLSVLIDVKSAHMSANLMYYSELLVPRFKQSRRLNRRKNVVICGVAMPTETGSTRRLNRRKNVVICTVKQPTVLGFTTIDILTSVHKYFEANGIQFSLSRQDEEGNWLPVWVFDYNSRFYRGLLNLATALRNLSEDEIPPARYLSTYFPEIPIAAILVASKRHLPEAFEDSLKDWQKRLVRKLYDVYRFHRAITLPFIIAALISHFIEQVALEQGEFEPSEYLDFLCIDGRPLGVVDPLNIVNNFVTYILKPLWGKRSDLSEYKIFQIHGMRLLRAKRKPSEPWETLVAWCQGCGFYPLVYGHHCHCEECKRLICDRRVPFEGDSAIMRVCSVCQLGSDYSAPCSSCRIRLIESKIDALEAAFQRREEQKQSEFPKRIASYMYNTLLELQLLRSDVRMSSRISQINELGFRILKYESFVLEYVNEKFSAIKNLLEEIEALREHANRTNRSSQIIEYE